MHNDAPEMRRGREEPLSPNGWLWSWGTCHKRSGIRSGVRRKNRMQLAYRALNAQLSPRRMSTLKPVEWEEDKGP